jgi:hypothetical protein
MESTSKPIFMMDGASTLRLEETCTNFTRMVLMNYWA